MDMREDAEVIDLDDRHFVSLETSREWPKYVVAWSVRRREGDSDYPLHIGSVERMPPPNGSDLEEMLAEMRQDAVAQATAFADAGGEGNDGPGGGHSTFLSRLFGRR